jgi:prephenate dehydratase
MARSSADRIAFQGEPGANSHLAASFAYPDMEAFPCPTFEDALAAVKEGAAALAMIPIENSVAGRVADIHHLLPHSGLYIVAEHFERVRHQLLTLPGVKLSELKTVHSHIMALGRGVWAGNRQGRYRGRRAQHHPLRGSFRQTRTDRGW